MYTGSLQNLQFNKENPSVMHIDINSCFATVEQQFDPSLRGKPVVVTARSNEKSCIVAPSIEAKEFGIKTGMRVFEARQLCSKIVPLAADPPKYRRVHKSMSKLLGNYTADLHPRSIDEFVLNLKNYPAFKNGMQKTAEEIKQKIKIDVGDWIRVSIGIGTNQFLAKIAAGMVKPDGLVIIDESNYKDQFENFELRDLYGIGRGNVVRLNNCGIFSVPAFYNADFNTLRSAFKSISAYYWYLRLRGWEIDDYQTNRRGFSQSFVLHKPETDKNKLSAILQKLVERMGERMRAHGYSARGIYIKVVYKTKPYSSAGDSNLQSRDLYSSLDLFKELSRMFNQIPTNNPVKQLAVGVFALNEFDGVQLEMFNDSIKAAKLADTVDQINGRWEKDTIMPSQMIQSKEDAPDTIAFGK